ncbi:methionine--tRNA ligase [Silvibacterium dinghuense]|uniref:Methionine--tRNA ligase n=1 Tax=Silvibacterium dinghuense TaxID=1560006 RepID=A0A4Q1SHL4_9BACT|nr:methionine--tRNA ligase [Silvibacterium dinghuense]RXS96879.1 methionine--tRNA ligase [Silvibacterium dinghuense]GGG94392.1 methionine--tRNA ligase [Silvibacterium dinghuense]
MSNKFYLTTPIYYVNARPHIGTTYTTVVADAIARRKRALGFDTWFLTGTDEHGQKIERSAEKAGLSPQQFTDQVSAQFRALWDRMGLTYDDYIRTTEPRHTRAVQKLFALLRDKGFIYKDTYTGQYCVSDEAFVDVPPGAPCPDCGRITETVSEENYFFKLSAFERPLLELYESQAEFIQPATRRNEVMSFVKAGLKDLSVSRTSFTWGIPVPGDEKHVIYVWMDALANYITALGWGSDDTSKFDKYWPADLHIVGKEITRFHCVYWPAFLMAAGLPLPKSIVGHGWLLFEESKMSKSRGNIVRAETILEVLGADALRYFLLREIVFGQDGNFSFDALVQRYNSDLANGYGNLVSRTLAMIGKYFDGVVPTPVAIDETADQRRTTLEQAATKTIAEFATFFDRYEFSAALAQLWSLVAQVDGYLTASAPWKKPEGVSEEQQQALRATVLSTAAEAIRILTALVYPVIPDAAAKVWAQLGLGDIRTADLKNLTWGGLKPGTKLGNLGPVFPRAEKDAVERMKQIEEENNNQAAGAATPPATPATEVPTEHPSRLKSALEGLATAAAESTSISSAAAALETFVENNIGGGEAAPAAEPGPAYPERSPEITIDDFIKVDLRVAQIKVAERVPKADKLLRLEVDLGYEQRQILAGLAETYAPESLVGRKVVIVANLAPRKLRGFESNGMVVAASLEGGKPALAAFLEDIEIGARLK